MSPAATTQRMTVEQFWDYCLLPENAGKRLELDTGKVIEMPPPGERHGTICWVVSVVLGKYLFERGAGYICTNDTGLIVARTPATVRGPDLVLFLEPKAHRDLKAAWIEDRPSLVVEVISPSDRSSQIQKRLAQYLDRGIPMIWIVDPVDRNVSVHRPNENHKFLEEDDELTGNGVLPDFRCKVADLFRLPGQP